MSLHTDRGAGSKGLKIKSIDDALAIFTRDNDSVEVIKLKK